MRVRVATLAAMACCTVTARLPAEGWVTARLVPWAKRLIAGGLDRGLAAAFEGELEQQLKSLIRLLERQHFGLGGLAGADQALHRRQQLEQLATDRQRARSRRGGLR